MNTQTLAGIAPISDIEFEQFRKLLFKVAGISLSPAKRVLLEGRLAKRLKTLGCYSFGEYYRQVAGAGGESEELQTMVDLLTTNETYFFREPGHFTLLRSLDTERRRNAPFRAWSAAASSGEEAYSMAMVLADALGDVPWEIVGTDISHRMIERARRGHYPMDRIEGIPAPLLKKYCLRGIGDQTGTLLVVRELRERVSFRHANLLSLPSGLGQFDVIFLRNVMIYFESRTKQNVIDNLLPCLKRGGRLVIGHSESLNGVACELVQEAPTIYRRPGGER